MNKIPIYFIPEGATEQEVVQLLYKRGILSQSAELKADILDREREGGYDQVIKLLQSLRGGEGILKAIERRYSLSQKRSKGPARVLLVFDQENARTSEERADEIWKDLGLSFDSIIDKCENLSEHKSENLHAVLHISSINEWNMFEGYILELLNGPNRLLIAENLMRSNKDPSKAEKLLNKAEREFTELMEKNGFPWIDAKARLYAYITAFQFRGSHVWFAKEVVEAAIKAGIKQELQRVFDCLIKAWERLCGP